MGTRGLYGFHKNGIDKLTYNHLGSYPDSLGKKIVEFCKCAGRDGMNSLFDHIELVSEMPSRPRSRSSIAWRTIWVLTVATGIGLCIQTKVVPRIGCPLLIADRRST